MNLFLLVATNLSYRSLVLSHPIRRAPAKCGVRPRWSLLRTRHQQPSAHTSFRQGGTGYFSLLVLAGLCRADVAIDLERALVCPSRMIAEALLATDLLVCLAFLVNVVTSSRKFIWKSPKASVSECLRAVIWDNGRMNHEDLEHVNRSHVYGTSWFFQSKPENLPVLPDFLPVVLVDNRGGTMPLKMFCRSVYATNGKISRQSAFIRAVFEAAGSRYRCADSYWSQLFDRGAALGDAYTETFPFPIRKEDLYEFLYKHLTPPVDTKQTLADRFTEVATQLGLPFARQVEAEPFIWALTDWFNMIVHGDETEETLKQAYLKRIEKIDPDADGNKGALYPGDTVDLLRASNEGKHEVPIRAIHL